MSAGEAAIAVIFVVAMFISGVALGVHSAHLVTLEHCKQLGATLIDETALACSVKVP